MKSIISIVIIVLLAGCASNGPKIYRGTKLTSTGLCQESSVEQEGDYAIPCKIKPPEYPRNALMNKVEGHVTFSLSVSGKGKPADIQIIESVPEGVFDKQALEAISAWRFKPEMVDGLPVKKEGLQYVLEFKLG